MTRGNTGGEAGKLNHEGEAAKLADGIQSCRGALGASAEGTAQLRDIPMESPGSWDHYPLTPIHQETRALGSLSTNSCLVSQRLRATPRKLISLVFHLVLARELNVVLRPQRKSKNLSC